MEDTVPDNSLNRQTVAEDAIADANVALDALGETLNRIQRTNVADDLQPIALDAIEAVEIFWIKACDIYNEKED